MGESLSTWTPSCNGSVRVELSGHRTTSDSGALLLREALDSSGVIEALGDNLVDARHPLRIRHSLTSQIRTLVLQRAGERQRAPASTGSVAKRGHMCWGHCLHSILPPLPHLAAGYSSPM